jgi:OFA family oxalate/formate antiporter-like MFS transporter
MPEKSERVQILISCACAIFWPGAFIFGFPGVMSQHWQQAFDVGRSEVGQTVFFILAGATCFMYLCGRFSRRFIGLYLCPGADGRAALVPRKARAGLGFF